MKKSILNLLLAAGMTLGAVGFAQTGTAIGHASPVVAPTYLGLGYVQGALQVSTSSSSAADLSPLVQAITFKDGQQPAGFKALHADTSLTEVTDYYWNTLSALGFTSSMDAASRRAVSYRFENGDSRLLAVFTQSEKGILADLSWTSAELVAAAD